MIIPWDTYICPRTKITAHGPYHSPWAHQYQYKVVPWEKHLHPWEKHPCPWERHLCPWDPYTCPWAYIPQSHGTYLHAHRAISCSMGSLISTFASPMGHHSDPRAHLCQSHGTNIAAHGLINIYFKQSHGLCILIPWDITLCPWAHEYLNWAVQLLFCLGPCDCQVIPWVPRLQPMGTNIGTLA